MKRFSRRYIYYSFLMNFILAAVASMMGFGEEITYLPYVIFGCTYLVLMIYSFLYYYTSRYEINEKGVTCTRGVLFKKKSFLEYSRIHAVNKKQGLIQQIFRIAHLLVDSGSSNTASSAEIMIIEESKIVDELMEIIKSKQEHHEIEDIKKTMEDKKNEKQVNFYNFTSKYKWAYILLNTLIALISLVIVFIVALIFIIAFRDLIEQSGEMISQIILIVALCFTLFVIVGFVLNIIQAFLGYYNFKIYRNNQDIEVNYGFFVKNSNTFKLNKVKAIKVEQSLIKRIFGYCSIKIEVIGLGETNDKGQKYNDVLIPLCKYSDVNFYMETILQEYLPIERKTHCKSYFSLFSWNLLWLFLLLIGTCYLVVTPLYLLNMRGYIFPIVLSICLVLVLSVIYVLIDNYLKYNYEGVGFRDNRITIYHGGFTRVQTTFLRKNIIGVEDVTTPLRKRRNIYSYIIHFKSNNMSNKTKVDIQGEEEGQTFLNLTRF